MIPIRDIVLICYNYYIVLKNRYYNHNKHHNKTRICYDGMMMVL